MRLFIRDQAPLVAVYLLQLFLVTLVYWLDGSRDVGISLYAGLLSVCLLSVYLVIRYIRNRTFYVRLAAEVSSTEELLKDKHQTPLAQSLQRLFKRQYRAIRPICSITNIKSNPIWNSFISGSIR